MSVINIYVYWYRCIIDGRTQSELSLNKPVNMISESQLFQSLNARLRIRDGDF
jgi:hypothetical protein